MRHEKCTARGAPNGDEHADTQAQAGRVNHAALEELHVVHVTAWIADLQDEAAVKGNDVPANGLDLNRIGRPCERCARGSHRQGKQSSEKVPGDHDGLAVPIGRNEEASAGAEALILLGQPQR